MVFVVAALLSIGLAVPLAPTAATHRPGAEGSTTGVSAGPIDLSALESAPTAAIPDAPTDRIVPGSELRSAPATGSLAILVSFAYSNQSALATLLSALGNASSPDYDHFLTAAQFDAAFSPLASTYDAARDYFVALGASNVTVLPDRTAIAFDASVAVASRIFHVSIASFRAGQDDYVAPTGAPSLPTPIAPAVLSVEGLGTASGSLADAEALGSPHAGVDRPDTTGAAAPPDGYLAPPTVGGTQLEYASDLQVAYDEQSLFAAGGYPTNATVATILWSGNYTGPPLATSCGDLTDGQEVGPWVPGDIDTFFNETLPAGEPHPTAYAVPIGSAPLPSCLASWDSSGAQLENTADIEMLGSTAPGAQIYTVYGPTESLVYLDTAFSEILSPPSSFGASTVAGLANVSVISNAWALADQDDASWQQDLEQAQARGITVLAASGDSGDDLESLDSVGTNAEFPASMAYNSYGDVAVGGTTVALDATTLRIANQTAWWVSIRAGGPEGSSGGISSVFAEPTWEVDSSANANLSGNGRGDPDLAALANNSLLTITSDGYQYLATNASGSGPYYAASGTSVAVSVVAGLVAEIDHAMRFEGAGPLGFFDPALYYWATQQDSARSCGTAVEGSDCGGAYLSPLPALPTDDVLTGSNYQYGAAPGWDFVTGWGSLDAYNFTIFALNVSSDGIYGRLAGVQDRATVTDLKVTSTRPKGAGGGVDDDFNATIEQNLFLADSLGAPIYGVQSMVYIHRASTGWDVNFTGRISYPFSGIYPNLTVYSWWIPKGSLETLPLTVNLTVELMPGVAGGEPTVELSYGVKGTSPLNFSVPGASFIIGADPYTFSWQGTNYTDGPRAGASPSGFLDPQFALVGGPGGDQGDFMSPTDGTVEAYVEPAGSTTFELANSSLVTSANAQSTESASNLSYRYVSQGTWTFAYDAGSTDQGIFETVPPRYAVEWVETGTLPPGSTWFVNLSSGVRLSAAAGVSSVETLLGNGSYKWSDGISTPGWASTPDNGTVPVDGAAVRVGVTLAIASGTVTFTASGPTFPFEWFVNISGEPSMEGTAASEATTLVYGTYSYKIATANSTWAATVPSGSFTLSGVAKAISVDILPVRYAFEMIASYGVNDYTDWTVTVGTTQKSDPITEPLTFPLTNGTYRWSVTNLSAGYYATPSEGSITVHGPIAHSEVVVITHVGSPSRLGFWDYVLIGGGVAAVALALFALRRRRRRAEPPPPRQRPRPGPRPPGTRPPPRRPPPRRGWVDPTEL